MRNQQRYEDLVAELLWNQAPGALLQEKQSSQIFQFTTPGPFAISDFSDFNKAIQGLFLLSTHPLLFCVCFGHLLSPGNPACSCSAKLVWLHSSQFIPPSSPFFLVTSVLIPVLSLLGLPCVSLYGNHCLDITSEATNGIYYECSTTVQIPMNLGRKGGRKSQTLKHCFASELVLPARWEGHVAVSQNDKKIHSRRLHIVPLVDKWWGGNQFSFQCLVHMIKRKDHFNVPLTYWKLRSESVLLN